MSPLPPEFMAAIIANKADDLLRLIAADWLDEHGDFERAEFIRVQCELGQPRCDRAGPIRCIGGWSSLEWCQQCHRTANLRNREFHLMASHRFKWIDGMLGPQWKAIERFSQVTFANPSITELRSTGPIHAIFRRGFIGEMVCGWLDWNEHGDVIANGTPLQGVWLSTMPQENGAFIEGRTGWIRALRSRWPNIEFTIPQLNANLGEII